jgi:formamidopyrimidine-DNA glycosylase
MPELPEITVLARQMKAELVGKTLTGIEVRQPKCLNVPEEAFVESLTGARLCDVTHRGKWLLVETTQGWLLLNLGMGGEILLVTRETLPKKHRLIFDFDDGACLAVNFWWFGYTHYAARLADHPMIARLGPHALDLTLDQFRASLHGRRGAIKSFLLDQSRIAGIGNVYVQDPLFKARLHPLRPINSLSDDEIAALWHAIRETLQEGIAHGGSAWELDLYGQKGRWNERFLLVGYREGQPCPTCSTPIEKIKTGSTSGFICPQCQPLDAA